MPMAADAGYLGSFIVRANLAEPTDERMRPSILIATAISGIVVALAVVAFLRPPPVPSDAGGPPEHTPTGRQPAFHLDATPEQRRTILEMSFGKITSDRAERLGALKDDIALLLDDPEAVKFIVAQWHVNRSAGKYADQAFADLFRLVKHPDFVEPTATLLASPHPDTRRKGLQAAQTQADPALGPRILAIYRGAAADPEPGGGNVPLKLDALQAAFACGGDSFPALLIEAFGDPSEQVAVQALTIASDRDIPGVEAEAKQILESRRPPSVRLHAAALLMRRNDLAARDQIIRGLDLKDPAMTADALHLIAKYRIVEATAKLTELRASATGEIRRLVTLALLRVGDRATWDEVIQAADVPGGDNELEALQLLAATGDPDSTPILLHALARGGDGRVQAVAAGISTSQEPAMLPVIQKLIEHPVGHPAELQEAPRVGGKALVPRLAQLLHEATEPMVQVRYLAWLAMIGGTEARDAMLRERTRIQRLVDEQIRLVDLEARRLGTVAPPLPR
jgi:hypothetical protein